MSKMINTWRSRMAQRDRFRRTLNELNSMTDAEAADLGLRRADFRATAWDAVYGGH